jgi:ParB-like chromosome segregation protein Spo0J
VSEFEPTRATVPSFLPPVRSDSFAPDPELEAALSAENPFPREGLPSGFRMRHDAHYVDQLTSSRGAAPHVRLLPLADLDSARAIDAREIEPLVKSIKKHGVLQPLHVRPRAGRFELIAGHRRRAAAAAAGLTEVPCLVHQVDETKARAIADADNLRIVDAAAIATLADTGLLDVPASGLAELSQSFSAIGSCLHLLGERDTVLRDRVALDLIRTEVHRAGRLVRCLHALRQDPALSEAPVSLASIVDHVVEGFAAEARLSGITLDVDATRELQTVRADAEWLTVGVSGALGGMLALVQQTKHASLELRVGASSSGASVMFEIEQHATSVPVWAQGRFFDAQWTDRPGGYQAAAELAAAKRVAELHRGGVELVPGDRGGCRLVMLLPTV